MQSLWSALSLWPWGTIWSAVGAVATLLGVVAIGFAVYQLRFDAWLKAQEVFTEEAFVEARKRVFAHFDDPQNPWPQPGGPDELTVCRKMNEMAHLFPFVGRKRAATEWGNPIAKAWLLLKPTVTSDRDKSHWTDKWKAFETEGNTAVDKQTALVAHRNTVLNRRTESSPS